MNVLLTNVEHVLDLRYNLFSLPTLTKNGHICEGYPTGVVVRPKSERSIVFMLSETLFSLQLYSYKIDSSSRGKSVLYSPRGNRPANLQLTP